MKDTQEVVRSMKIAMLGESGVGKTCIIERYFEDTFNECSVSTKGASLKSKVLKSADEQYEVKQLVWDTAGQEMYRSLAPFYYKDADVVIFVYDITNRQSYDGLNYWIDEVKQNGQTSTLFTIAGNKCDDIDNEKVEVNEAKAYAKQNNASLFLASAKDNVNVREMFTEAVIREFPELKESFLE